MIMTMDSVVHYMREARLFWLRYVLFGMVLSVGFIFLGCTIQSSLKLGLITIVSMLLTGKVRLYTEKEAYKARVEQFRSGAKGKIRGNKYKP